MILSLINFPSSIAKVKLLNLRHQAPHIVPWGNRTAESTDPYTDVPDTGNLFHVLEGTQRRSHRSNHADAMFSLFLGVTRRYNFTISRGTIAPSGLLKPALLVNNQFPGVSVNPYKFSLNMATRTMTHGPMTSR